MSAAAELVARGAASPPFDIMRAAYAELVEFIRAAVQLVYDELAGLRQGQPVSQSGH